MDRDLPFLRRIRVRNYRSIASCDVTFAPLLVLLGPNAAGKSNFLDALQFLAHALGTTPANALETRGGLEEVLRRPAEDADELSFDLELMVPFEGESIRVRYGFAIGRDRSGRRPFEVRWERCLAHRHPGMGDTSVAGGQGSVPGEDGFSVGGGRITGGSAREGRIEKDRLYLPVAAAVEGVFARIHLNLISMFFYQVDVERMRRIESRTRQRYLGPSAEHVGSFLGTLDREHPAWKARIDDYIRAIVPEATGVSERVLDSYSTVELRTRHGDRDLAFGPEAMSEGTLRAAGVLTALFQPAVLEGEVALLGIEEPETSLHPAAAGALFDALTEASERVQVVVTTQSADLLDRDEIDPRSVRVVTMSEGITTIGEIDDVSRRIVEDRRATIGELMRGSQLQPKPPAETGFGAGPEGAE
ncbi:AAA family ATPase [Sphaerisporangium sp. TRM90804]|uniref:AAA family ATPase n=1 Tax=Sphaerisporangium sp. TRM90804 TaxID=3031113 RepID=UPI0024486AC5|nr:AAA family ATPase [Sphaerisporangium sp. TRM90804]MDH2427378.1 AAA family ATPase [Sphaerisporangium sp. TRM90804]